MAGSSQAQPIDEPLVQRAAGELRALQEELADRGDAERAAAIAAALEQATVGMAETTRAAFLDHLLEQFPAFGQVLVEPAAPAAGGATAEQWNDPAALIARLAVLAGREPSRRREVLARLKPLVGATVPDDSLRQLQRQLALSERTAIDAGKAMELALQLIELVRRLETFVNGVWHTIGKNLGGSVPRPVVEAFAHFLAGSAAGDLTAEGRVRAELDSALATLDRRVRVLIATLRAFSQQHAEKFAPAEIQSLAAPGFLGNKARACWGKYVELCGGEDRDALEAEIAAMYVSIISRIYLEHRPA
jgi:hypothetical protein